MLRALLSVVVLGFFCLNLAAEEKGKGQAQPPKAFKQKDAKPQQGPKQEAQKPQGQKPQGQKPQAQKPAQPETPQAKFIAQLKADIAANEVKFFECRRWRRRPAAYTCRPRARPTL